MLRVDRFSRPQRSRTFWEGCPLPPPRALLVLAAGSLANAAALAVASPVVLLNTTPSEPIGLYIRTPLAPREGRLIAFRAPAAAFPYADRRLGYLHTVPLLKRVVAGFGDRVCSRSGQLSINGQVRGRIAERDGEGRQLPHWAECRTLRPGEFFALASRRPDSFDSRYFGPVRSGAVIGVYRPLWAFGERR